MPRTCTGSDISARRRAAITLLLANLAGGRSGNALVEAALIFPILIALFLGVSEFSEAFTLKRRLEAAANTSADLVARTQAVSTVDLAGIKSMLDEMIKPFPPTPLGVVVTSVVADGTNTTRVLWSDAQGKDVVAHTAGSVILLPTGLTEPNTSIVLAEVKYTFRSTLATMILGDLPMQTQAYFRPRLNSQVEKID
jgi:Flp pilus assembly protein TadG